MKTYSIFLVLFSTIFTQSIFFSEYAEGSSNNKYLEIYNPTSDVVNLSDYAFPNSTNGSDGQYEYWNSFDEGSTIAPGDVFVICHGSVDESIIAECDQFHTYLSNGDDGMCLAQGTEDNFTCIDWIGDWNDDPGDAWDVCGEGDTKDNTLVRMASVTSGSEWSVSSDVSTCEWIVYGNNTWNYIGSHPHDDDDPTSEDCGNGVDDDGDGYIDCDDWDCDDDPSCGGSSEDCSNGVDDDGDSYIDCDDFDCCGDPNCIGSCEDDCSNGVDDDGDGFIDCNDFDCTGDEACEGGSCAEYGCVGYTPENLCQCNDLCEQYNNCCDDYEEVCGDVNPSDEDCSNGVDDDGDGYIDCDDWDCDGTNGDIDPACDDGENDCNDSMVELFFSEYAEGSSYNKYLEIYNPSDSNVSLSCYAYPSVSNGPDMIGTYDYWNEFESGAVVAPGDVYVICHGSSDAPILSECDENYSYLSNGDDGFALVYGNENEFTALDWIGDWNEDPGDGWDVCGVSNGTKEHTLVRNPGIISGNEWSISSNEETCEWQVLDQNNWDNLGYHISDPDANIYPSADAGEDQVVSGGDLVTLDGSNSSDSDGDIIAFVWSQISGPIVSLSDYDEPIVTFIAPDEGTLEFQLQVYDNEGESGTDIVSVLISGGAMSIYEIQETNVQGTGNDCYPSPYLGQVVTVSGIVTAIKPDANPNFYFQDSGSELFSGVYVYDNTIEPEFGDELLLTVEVEEYYGLTELTNSISSVVLSSDNLIEPTLISTSDLGGGCSLNAEQYEGMLVSIENLIVMSDQNDYGEWTVDDGSGECMIDDYFFDGTMDSYIVGSTIASIIGVVNYAYGDYRILPRNSDDINIDGGGCTADGDVNLDGSTDVLDVVQIVQAVLGIVDFNENQVCISDVNSDNSVDVLDIVVIVDLILNLTSQSSDPLMIEKNMINRFINSNNRLRN